MFLHIITRLISVWRLRYCFAISFLLLFPSFNFVAAQTTNICIIDTTCPPNRPSINNLGKDYIEDTKTDTLEEAAFQEILKNLKIKMSLNQCLSLTEDVKLVKIMNTISWREFFKQNDIMQLFPFLLEIEKLFNQKYQKALDCKYHVYWGRGGSSYYQELHLNYMGNPFACGRYFINIPKEFSPKNVTINQKDSLGYKIGYWLERNEPDNGGEMFGRYESYNKNKKDGIWTSSNNTSYTIFHYENDWLMDEKTFSATNNDLTFHQFLNSTKDTLTVVEFQDDGMSKELYLIVTERYVPYHFFDEGLEHCCKIRREFYNKNGKLEEVEDQRKAKVNFFFEPDTSVISGTLKVEMYYGKPNYGEDTATDEKEYCYILYPSNNLNVLQRFDHGTAGANDGECVINVVKFQLAATNDINLHPFVDKKIKVTGTFYRGYTGHHHTDVLLYVIKVEKL